MPRRKPDAEEDSCQYDKVDREEETESSALRQALALVTTAASSASTAPHLSLGRKLSVLSRRAAKGSTGRKLYPADHPGITASASMPREPDALPSPARCRSRHLQQTKGQQESQANTWSCGHQGPGPGGAT